MYSSPGEVCDLFRVALLGALDPVLADRPITTTYVGLGAVAWDDCCGQLTVGYERQFRYAEFPQDLVGPEYCNAGWVGLDIVATLVRCVPTPDDLGRAPTQDALQAAHSAVMDDAALVWAALTGDLPDSEWERTNVVQTFVGGEGGCIAIETRFTLGTEQTEWC